MNASCLDSVSLLALNKNVYNTFKTHLLRSEFLYYIQANKGSRAGVAYSRLFKYTQQLLCWLYRNEDWAPYPIKSVLCYLSQNPVRNPLRQTTLVLYTFTSNLWFRQFCWILGWSHIILLYDCNTSWAWKSCCRHERVSLYNTSHS
jgi:hypothetical protein